MKRLAMILTGILLSVAVFAQGNEAKGQEDLQKVKYALEKSNLELNYQLKILNNDLKNSRIEQSWEIDSIIGLLQETQYQFIKNNDSLEKTCQSLSDLKEETKSNQDSFTQYIFKNRLSLIIVVFLLILLNFILFIFMNKRMSQNAIRIENNFIKAYETFDQDIRSASAMLNKHIKETKSDLDDQVKSTKESLDIEIVRTRDILDEKLEETKKALDEEVIYTKDTLGIKIQEIESLYNQRINETRILLDKKLIETKEAIAVERNASLKILEEKIAFNKKTLEEFYIKLKEKE